MFADAAGGAATAACHSIFILLFYLQNKYKNIVICNLLVIQSNCLFN